MSRHTIFVTGWILIALGLLGSSFVVGGAISGPPPAGEYNLFADPTVTPFLIPLLGISLIILITGTIMLIANRSSH